MSLTQVFFFVVLAFAVDALKWKNCDGSSPVQIKEIKLSPHPVTLRKGAKVTASGKFRVSGAAGTQYKLHLKLERYVGWWWNTIPCSWYKQCEHNVGCDQLIGLLEGEQCPLQPKDYIVKQQSVVLPDISLPSFLTNGWYRIRGDLRDRANNKRISCVQAEVEIRS